MADENDGILKITNNNEYHLYFFTSTLFRGFIVPPRRFD